VFLEEWYANQSHLRGGTARLAPDLNPDKRIETYWTNIGFQYTFNRDWGIVANIPYADRTFTTTADDGSIVKFPTHQFGDLEVRGVYTGFSKDQSTGLVFGVKFATGSYTAVGFDRDTQVGTGSTDLILGGFHRGLITGDNAWQYFTQARFSIPFLVTSAFDPLSGTNQTYRPGAEFNASAGIVYNNGYGWLGFNKVTPLFQLIGSHREHDSGTGSFPINTGYDRLFAAPGVEFTYVLDEANKKVLKVYADVELPVFQRLNAGLDSSGAYGQLAAPALFKLSASYNF